MSASRTKINPNVNSLLDASREGRLDDVVDLVKGKGVDVDCRSKMLETPIMLASNYGHVEVVKALIGMEADLKATDKFGKTALIHAANGGHIDIINMLVQHSHEELKSPCKWGFTAKDWAEHNGHKEVSQMLIQIEKEVDARNGNGVESVLSFVQSLNNDLNEEDVTEVEAPLTVVAPDVAPQQPAAASFVRVEPAVEMAPAEEEVPAVVLPGPLPMLSSEETAPEEKALPMEETVEQETVEQPVLEVEVESATLQVEEPEQTPAETEEDVVDATVDQTAQEPAAAAVTANCDGLEAVAESTDTAFPELEESDDTTTAEPASAAALENAVEPAVEVAADEDEGFNEEDSFRDVVSSDEHDDSHTERGIALSAESAAKLETASTEAAIVPAGQLAEAQTDDAGVEAVEVTATDSITEEAADGAAEEVQEETITATEDVASDGQEQEAEVELAAPLPPAAGASTSMLRIDGSSEEEEAREHALLDDEVDEEEGADAVVEAVQQQLELESGDNAEEQQVESAPEATVETAEPVVEEVAVEASPAPEPAAESVVEEVAEVANAESVVDVPTEAAVEEVAVVAEAVAAEESVYTSVPEVADAADAIETVDTPAETVVADAVEAVETVEPDVEVAPELVAESVPESVTTPEAEDVQPSVESATEAPAPLEPAAVETTAEEAPSPHHEATNEFSASHPIDDEEHMTALIWAAFHGQLEEVKKLVTKLSDVNLVDEHGMTALHFAANAGHAEVVKVLLGASANINAMDENGSTPFHWAAANCHLDVVDALLSASADINAKDRNGLSALLWAADMGHLEVVQILIKDGADLNSVDNNGLNALLWAADRGHVVCVHALLATGIDVNIADKNGYTALHRAANGGYLDITKALVAANANLSLLDKNAMTALDWAEENDHLDIAVFLSGAMHTTAVVTTAPAEAEADVVETAAETVIENPTETVAEAVAEAAATESEVPVTPHKEENAFDEANPIDEDHMTALILAAHHGELEQVKELITKHSDVNFADEHGMSALHYAANAGHLEVVKVLLGANAEVNAVDQHGSTPFHWASANCHLDVMDALLAASADPNVADQHAMTALHWAADMGHLDVLLRLVQVSDVNLEDENGLSALLWAADRGHVDCVKALLDVGVNVNATDLNSYTALHRASNAGLLDIVTALVAGNADLMRVDKNDMTAYDWAVSQEHDDVAALLKKFMPSPAAPVIANTSTDGPLAVEQMPTEETKGEGQQVQMIAEEPAAAADVPAESAATEPEAASAPVPMEIVYESAADVQVLRRALEFDTSTIHLKESILCDRYYLQPGFPIHSSMTSVVVNAVDFGLKIDYEELYRQFCKKGADAGPTSPKGARKMTSITFRQCVESLLSSTPPAQLPPLKTAFTSTEIDEAFAQYAKESTTGIFLSHEEFLQFCLDQMGATRNVVIKFMRDEAPYQWENTIRRLGKLESRYVVGTIAVDNAAELKEQVQKVKLTDPAGTLRRLHNYPHALIMPAADRSLDSIIRQERPDFSYTRVIMRQVASALQHIHQRGIMHGDLTALNIARINGSMVLVDMDAAVEFGDAGSVTGGKFSSGVLPPEMFATLNRQQEQEYEDYWQVDMKKNSELWNKVRPVKLSNGRAIVVRTVHPSRPDGSGLPYEIVNASDMIDIWSFGLLLYCSVNPSGNNLLGVNQDGDLVRTEENYNCAANWSDEDLSNAILHTITDDLAADLLQRILRRNPANRCDIVQILAHPFFTDPTATKKGGRAILKSIRKQRDQLLKFDRQVDSIFHSTETVVDLSDEAFLQIKKSDVVLMRSVFDAAELLVPTCFIIVNNKIIEDTGNSAAAAGVITSSNWIEHLSDLSNTEDELYLYLLDEYTMQPILTVPAPAKGKTPSTGHFEHYPFKIHNPAEFVPAVLPLLLLSMKAAALLHGTSTLVNSIGHPNPPVALEKAVSWTGSLDVFASLYEFSNLQDSEEATAHLTGHNNTSLEALKVRAKYVRDSALHELRILFSEHHVLYDNAHNVVNGHHGQARFCGLRRVCVPGGFVCWTQEENVLNIKSGLEATTHLRLVESIAP